jgi:hypothetical protein
LRTAGVRDLGTGVNADQCVLHSLIDANFSR